MEEHIIKCTQCNKDKVYNNKRCWYNAIAKQKKTGVSICLKCFGKNISLLTKGKENPEYKRSSNVIKEFFRKCPNCNVDIGYHTKKTMSQGIRNNTTCIQCCAILSEKGKKLNAKLSPAKRLQMIATREGFMSYEEYSETIKGFKRYLRKCWRLTYRQPIETLENFDRRGISGIEGAYQMDHIISIKDGYLKNIPEETIASMDNLRMIPWRENIAKGSSSLWHF